MQPVTTIVKVVSNMIVDVTVHNDWISEKDILSYAYDQSDMTTGDKLIINRVVLKSGSISVDNDLPREYDPAVYESDESDKPWLVAHCLGLGLCWSLVYNRNSSGL